jgi:hypothetical protein
MWNNSGNGVNGNQVNTVLNDGLPARQHNFPAAKCPTDPFPSTNPRQMPTTHCLGPDNLANWATASYEASMGAQQMQAIARFVKRCTVPVEKPPLATVADSPPSQASPTRLGC